MVALAGQLELSTADRLRAELGPVLAARPPHVVFDLTDLDFVDSSGLAVLLEAAGKLPAVSVRGASDVIRRVIEGTGLSGVLGLEP